MSETLLPDATGSQDADFVVLGKVVDAYGLNGAVKVLPYADDPLAWGKLADWWLAAEPVSKASVWKQVALQRCRVHGDVLVATLAGCADRNAAEAMRGMLVGVPRAAMPPTADDEYYWADLIGLEVVNTRGQMLGRVLGLIETAANDVLRVGDGVDNERLLPFVAAVVLQVDRQERRICVEWEADW